jgi:hypothetical protein
VQRGQDTDPAVFDPRLSFPVGVFSSGANELAPGKGGSRLAAAVIAAFNTVVKGGLMPHARHGGRLVVAVAVAGSKLEGTGLEKVHIGQIQVALIGFGEGDFDGPVWGSGWRVDC